MYEDISNQCLDEFGNIIQLVDNDAVKNSILGFFNTKAGEVINRPKDGGALEQFQFKRLTESNRSLLYFYVLTNLGINFIPAIEIKVLDIGMDRANNKWLIYLVYAIPNTNITGEVTTEIAKVFKKKSTNIEEITLVGKQLRNFILVKLWTMKNISLKWSSKGYVWGRYLFVNFDEYDPYYKVITELVNSNFYDITGTVIKE